ncbi:MAG: alpha/beta fold hydrolase [Ktedonobacterales bacterium]|nr:alpha/beta fold hydrolase [Ktedonobacterales bacterium]
MQPTTTSGYADIHGGKLYYEVAGTGPALLLIHAGVADHRMWDDQWAAFAQHFRVIRYDTREFGKTTSQDVAYSNRQDIADLLSHLGISRIAIMGVSRGGQIATDFTLEHPDMVTHLISVAGGISGISYDDITPLPEEVAINERIEAVENAKDYPPLIDLEVHVWGDGPAQPEGRMAAGPRAKMRQMVAENYAAHQGESPTAQPLDPPAIHRLGEIRVPTLVIEGDLDFDETHQVMGILAARVAGAQHVVIAGTAHLPNMEQPAQFTQIVLDFLRK